ncbi:sulfite exporter TauE/SafE family protein [Paenibacillus lemnae]|uniref:Probable membrane transporter protein n=1 Tax=Paenibacillus lemnae TaxID=1330551 RepID=A0A848MAQ2_PAELE|nr:sulfite exporter TauE/SafE family protein [Paenibacillus lemnae]NMO97240.1 sulfite exporter TauE/SafE family protein [Paenibacillus lemnae]
MLTLHIVMILIGLIGAFFSGLLGIGGAIINFPMLLYVPGWFGLEGFTAKEVAAISMLQVFFASLSGMLSNRISAKGGTSLIHKKLVIQMGVSILIGSLAGSIFSVLMNSAAINMVYGVLAVIAVIMMLIPTQASIENKSLHEVTYPVLTAVTAAFLVGCVSGIVGAGGAFILIPIMLSVLKIPVRITIASSLAIVFMSAVGGVVGKIAAGGIPLWPAVFAVTGSLLGAPVGTYLSRRLNIKLLRYALVLLIAVTAVKVWSDILS